MADEQEAERVLEQKSVIPIGDGCKETLDMSNMDTVLIFCQNGLIFGSIVLGFICACHILFVNTQCRNSLLIFSVIICGLFSVLAQFIMLYMHGLLNITPPPGVEQTCIDYSFPVTLTNAVVLFVVSQNIARRRVSSSLGACFIAIASGLCMAAGLFIVFSDAVFPPRYPQEYESPEIFQYDFGSQSQVVWSLCQKNVFLEKTRLLIEYGLLYVPALVITLVCVQRSYASHDDCCPPTFKIIVKECSKDSIHPCVCARLNTTLLIILAYSFTMLFIVRPAMFVYSSSTSGLYRDVVPGLVSGVAFNVLSIEYLLNVWKRKSQTEAHSVLNKPKYQHV